LGKSRDFSPEFVTSGILIGDVLRVKMRNSRIGIHTIVLCRVQNVIAAMWQSPQKQEIGNG
jgi:hypothetical protein